MLLGKHLESNGVGRLPGQDRALLSSSTRSRAKRLPRWPPVIYNSGMILLSDIQIEIWAYLKYFCLGARSCRALVTTPVDKEGLRENSVICGPVQHPYNYRIVLVVTSLRTHHTVPPCRLIISRLPDTSAT